MVHRDGADNVSQQHKSPNKEEAPIHLEIKPLVYLPQKVINLLFWFHLEANKTTQVLCHFMGQQNIVARASTPLLGNRICHWHNDQFSHIEMSSQCLFKHVNDSHSLLKLLLRDSCWETLVERYVRIGQCCQRIIDRVAPRLGLFEAPPIPRNVAYHLGVASKVEKTTQRGGG